MIDPSKQPVRVTHKNKQYIVKYVYDQGEDLLKGEYSFLPIRGKTIAYIGDIKDPDNNMKTVAYCSMKDQFVKLKGRIVATIRLIQLLEILENKGM